MTRPAAVEPYKAPRVAALTIAWIFSVIGSSVGLNALIKSNQQKSKLKSLAPPPTVVNIDTSDIFNVGVLATTVCLILAILASKSLLGMFFGRTKSFIRRTLRAQALIGLLFCTILFGAMVPYTVYFANRQARVTAFIGTTQLPESIIKATEAKSGSTGVYKHIYYLKLLLAFGWTALFFNLIACAVLFKAAGAAKKYDESLKSAPLVSSSAQEVKEEPPSHFEEKGLDSPV